MQKVLAYPLTIVHFLIFGFLLVVFHGMQLFCYHIFGYHAQQKSVVWLNRALMFSQLPLGNTFSINKEQLPPRGPSYIFVCNHQGMFDIPPLTWYLQEHDPKFISKIELAKGIPSISLNLRIGGNAVIDRKDSRAAIQELIRFAKEVNEKGRSVVIFPEGTRSRTGETKPFKRRGLLTLMKYIPDAHVVPITINNSWKVNRYGKFPYGMGNHIHLHVHEPIPLAGTDPEQLMDEVEEKVVSKIVIG